MRTVIYVSGLLIAHAIRDAGHAPSNYSDSQLALLSLLLGSAIVQDIFDMAR